MSFDPSKWFLGSLEVFAALVPGGIILYAIRLVAIAAGAIEDTSWPDQKIDWAIFLVGSLVLGYLAHPPAHILNWLYDRTYRQWRRQGGDPLLKYAQQEAAPHLGLKDSVYAWAKSEVAAASKEQAARIDLIEGISKMFRTLAFLAIVAAILVLAAQAWLWTAALAVLAVLSFFVFSERRFAATKEVYQSLKRIRGQ